MPRGKKVTTAIYCNRYYPQGVTGLCVISIRVTYCGVKRYYDTGKLMTAPEFDALFTQKIKPDQKKILVALNEEEKRAIDCIEQLKTGFTFERFNKLYLSNLSIAVVKMDKL